MSKYIEVAKKIKDSIDGRQKTHTTILPVISFLARQYDVSERTIGRSIDYLVDQSVLERKHGSIQVTWEYRSNVWDDSNMFKKTCQIVRAKEMFEQNDD